MRWSNRRRGFTRQKFLDAVTDETIIFRDKVSYHAGNYQSTTEEQQRRKVRLKEVGNRLTILFEWVLTVYQLDNKRRKHILSSIQKSVQQTKSSGDDKRLRLVVSRKKVDYTSLWFGFIRFNC